MWSFTPRAAALVVGCLLPVMSVQSVVPVPGNVYYGVARKGDGTPLSADDKAEIMVRVARGNVLLAVASASVVGYGTGTGPNYVARFSQDDGAAPAYSPIAVLAGERPVFYLRKGGIETPFKTVAPLFSGPGTIQELNLGFFCEDSDADGLCDEWEQRWFSSVTAQDGTGDMDGDGFTNLQEQSSGWVPTSADSPGGVEKGPLLRVGFDRSGRLMVGWDARDGRTDILEWSDGPSGPWVPVPTDRVSVSGADRSMDIGTMPHRFVRVRRQ